LEKNARSDSKEHGLSSRGYGYKFSERLAAYILENMGQVIDAGEQKTEPN
jgi:hypothetical protein